MSIRYRILFLILVGLAGCQQQMAHQPAYRPLSPSEAFPDGRSARPLVPGTVARGQMRTDAPLYFGTKTLAAADAGDLPQAAATVAAGFTPLATLTPPSGDPAGEFVTTFPEAVDAATLKRGQERYTIYCSVCHDSRGTGHGKIVERGYTRPPSLITDNSRGLARRGLQVSLREVPVGYIFEVMTNGYGAMPDYHSQIKPQDRWAIVAYVRALQLSQYAELNRLPPEVRQQLGKELGGKP